MLQIFAGRSGSGKTKTLFDQVYRDSEEKEVILLVPEQSSFQSEKRILDTLGAAKAANITVLSFKRLCYRIAEKHGGRNGKRIDDGDKAVLMSLAAQQTADKLTLYGNKSHRTDTVELMLGAVNEYKMCSVEADDLFRTAEQIKNERLRQKLIESATVYEAYTAILGRTYCDPDDDLTYLYDTLCEHKDFQGKTVYIDSFNGFSGQETKIIECIIRQADFVGITLDCDKTTVHDTENSFFAEPNKTRLTLKALAEKHNIEILPDRWFTEQKRFLSPSLAAVEESIFRFDGDKYENDGSVILYEAEDEYDEIQQAARDISRLVREEGCCYRDINVICRNSERYGNMIESEFPKYEIPFFLSNPIPLETKPLIKLILTAFDTVHSSFDTEKLFAFLKTGLTELEPNEIFLLENYAYLWDIRGKAWKQPFTLNPDGNTEKENPEELAQLEEYRQRAIAPLQQFSDELRKAKNGGEMTKAVFMLLSRMNTAEKIKHLVGYFDKLGEMKAKEEQARIWDLVMVLLDKMYHILADIPMDSRRYCDLLRLMIHKSPVSDIPQTLDQVTIGTAGTIRSENPRAVFVIGAAENVFPAVPSAGGIFSDSEREELLGADLPLYDTLYAASLKEKYIAYSAVSAPREKLFVSFPKTNIKDEAGSKSIIIRELEAIFDDLEIRTRSSLSDNDLFYTARQSFELCAAQWNDNTPRSAALRQFFVSNDEYHARAAAIERTVLDLPFAINNPATPKKLFGERPVLSASQIESYSLCPFAYFCRYGLHAAPRKKAAMDMNLYGSVVHFVLEKILTNIDFAEFKKSSQEQLSELVEKYLEEYIDLIGGEEQRTSRFMSQCRGMKKNIVTVLRQLIDEFENSSFEPTDFELTINDKGGELPSYVLELPDGEKVSVVGKIDRVDTFVKGNEKYIRIIDYKTGSKKFKLSNVLYGLNVQMLLYLSAIKKNGIARYSENNAKTLIPAGVLYMPSTPSSETGQYHSDGQTDSLLSKRRKSFKMNGLLINDTSILAAMENNVAGLYIPASLNKNGSLSATSSVASLEEFGRIFAYIDKEIIKIARSLLGGKIERMPSKGTKIDACAYCDYKNVCGYEDGKSCRSVENLKNADVLERMKGGNNIE